MADSAADRMRERVRALLERPGKSQRRLAHTLDLDHGEVSKKLSKDPRKQRDFTLRQIDAVASYLGVPPALLIQKDTSTLQELDERETSLVRHWRQFPLEVQEAIMVFLDFFSGVAPERKEARALWTRWRRLSANSRQRLENLLEDTLKAEQLAKRATRDQPAAADHTAGNLAPAQKSQRSGRK